LFDFKYLQAYPVKKFNRALKYNTAGSCVSVDTVSGYCTKLLIYNMACSPFNSNKKILKLEVLQKIWFLKGLLYVSAVFSCSSERRLIILLLETHQQ